MSKLQRFNDLLRSTIRPKQYFLVTIVDYFQKVTLDYDGIAQPKSEFDMEDDENITCLKVEDRDMAALQRILNQNELLYTTQPFVGDES